MIYQKKICIIGEFGVGKTSLVSRYVRSIFSERYQTTIGVKIDKKQILVEESQVNLVIWDLAGESPLRTLKPSQISGASGFLLVADGTRLETLDTAIILQQRVADILGPVPFMLVVNKADLIDSWTLHEGNIDEFHRKGWDVRVSSAKTGEGVEKLFLDLAKRLIQDRGEIRAD
jgi:small GTP-binding protein